MQQLFTIVTQDGNAIDFVLPENRPLKYLMPDILELFGLTPVSMFYDVIDGQTGERLPKDKTLVVVVHLLGTVTVKNTKDV